MALSGSRCLPFSLVYFPPPWPRCGQRREGSGGGGGRRVVAVVAWSAYGGCLMSARKPAEFMCKEVFHSSKDARVLDFFFVLALCCSLLFFCGSVCVCVLACLCVHSY